MSRGPGKLPPFSPLGGPGLSEYGGSDAAAEAVNIDAVFSTSMSWMRKVSVYCWDVERTAPSTRLVTTLRSASPSRKSRRRMLSMCTALTLLYLSSTVCLGPDF